MLIPILMLFVLIPLVIALIELLSFIKLQLLAARSDCFGMNFEDWISFTYREQRALCRAYQNYHIRSFCLNTLIYLDSLNVKLINYLLFPVFRLVINRIDSNGGKPRII